MKVLLIKDVKNLGKAGEIKEVKPGYGNNFLIAKALAKPATKDVIKAWEEEQSKLEEARKNELQKLNSLSQKLTNATLKIVKKVGANGSLFGAITKDEIAHTINDAGFSEIDKKMIEIKKPIKSTGVFDISIKLGHGIHAVINLEIVSE